MSKNILQTILQGAWLNFLKIPNAVVIQAIQQKSEHPEEPKGSYFGTLQEFFDVTAAHFNNQSHTPQFDVESFKEKTIQPSINFLIDKIEEAFSISDQLKGFTSKDLTDFGEEVIISLADFS